MKGLRICQRRKFQVKKTPTARPLREGYIVVFKEYSVGLESNE
jgi:hypothetical protein